MSESTNEQKSTPRGPAASYMDHIIDQAVRLDAHRRNLAADNPAVSGMLLDIEQLAFRRLHEQAQEAHAWMSAHGETDSDWFSGTSSNDATPNDAKPVNAQRETRQRIVKSVTSLLKHTSSWKKRSNEASKPDAEPKSVVDGDVVELSAPLR